MRMQGIRFIIRNNSRARKKRDSKAIIKETHNESVKFEFMETIPSSLEPESSERIVEGLVEAPADPAATDEADVSIQSLTRPSTPHVTCVRVVMQVGEKTQKQIASCHERK
jgi:hypothetical protein